MYSFKASKKKAVPSNDEDKGTRVVKGNVKKGGELYELCNIQMHNWLVHLQLLSLRLLKVILLLEEFQREEMRNCVYYGPIDWLIIVTVLVIEISTVTSGATKRGGEELCNTVALLTGSL